MLQCIFHLHHIKHKNLHIHCVRKKSLRHSTHYFVKYWPIFDFFTVTNSRYGYGMHEICNKAIIKYHLKCVATLKSTII